MPNYTDLSVDCDLKSSDCSCICAILGTHICLHAICLDLCGAHYLFSNPPGIFGFSIDLLSEIFELCLQFVELRQWVLAILLFQLLLLPLGGPCCNQKRVATGILLVIAEGRWLLRRLFLHDRSSDRILAKRRRRGRGRRRRNPRGNRIMMRGGQIPLAKQKKRTHFLACSSRQTERSGEKGRRDEIP